MIQTANDDQRRQFFAEEGIVQGTRHSIDAGNGLIKDVIEPLGERFIEVGSAFFRGGRQTIMLRPHGMICIYADHNSGRPLGAEMVAPGGEHLAHLLAWRIQRELTVSELLAMPFYHLAVEETLKAAILNALDQVDSDPLSLPGFEML